jgi:hypothetical protein
VSGRLGSGEAEIKRMKMEQKSDDGNGYSPLTASIPDVMKTKGTAKVLLPSYVDGTGQVLN